MSVEKVLRNIPARPVVAEELYLALSRGTALPTNTRCFQSAVRFRAQFGRPDTCPVHRQRAHKRPRRMRNCLRACAASSAVVGATCPASTKVVRGRSDGLPVRNHARGLHNTAEQRGGRQAHRPRANIRFATLLSKSGPTAVSAKEHEPAEAALADHIAAAGGASGDR